MLLEKRRALVTGGGSGIGRHIALALAGEGADVALLGRRRERLEEVGREVGTLGRRSLALVADVTRPEEVEGEVGRLLEQWGGVEVLVNNAGVQGPIGPAHRAPVDEWLSALQVNLGGCFLCARAVLPGMIERGYGKIVNLSGGGAVSPRPFYSAYSASKAGVVRFTETLAAEVRPHHIDVNAIAPGAINTRMLEETLRAGAAAGEEAREEALRQKQEGGADPGRAAALVVFLASRRSDGLTGRLLSALWDPWEEMDVGRVMASEAYTVRRLKPAEGAR